MTDTIYSILKHWTFHKRDNPKATFESFMDYLVEQDEIGNGL